MAKRTRKPSIKPELRREWLRRNEENGESPPQIAAKDGFDVRTVRKQIDTAKQEREAREARSIVLRSALEKHYEDLLSFAEALNSRISGLGDVSIPRDNELLEAALRQHLPRSPIWNYLLKWEKVNKEKDEIQRNIDILIEEAVKAEPRLTPLMRGGMDGVIPGITAALTFQSKHWSQGYKGLNPKDNLLTEPAGDGIVNLRYGAFFMGIMDTEHVNEHKKIVGKVLETLEARIKEWEPYRNVEQRIVEIGRLRSKLQEELAIIRLRRIVPGRCKYCPL